MKHKRTSYLEHFTLVNPVHPGYRNLPFLALNSDQWSHPSILTDLFDICPAGPFFYLALWNGFINIETLLSKPLLLLASLFLYCSNIQQLIMWFLSTMVLFHCPQRYKFFCAKATLEQLKHLTNVISDGDTIFGRDRYAIIAQQTI